MKNLSKKKVVSLGLIGFAALVFGFANGSTEVIKRTVGAKLDALAYTHDEDLAHNGKYYTDFNSITEAREASAMVNAEICEEGNTVLKNDGTLPLKKGAKISLFGMAQNSIIGSGSSSGLTDLCKTYEDSLERAGFYVNPILDDWYDTKASSGGGAGMGMGWGSASYSETEEDGEHKAIHSPSAAGANPCNFDGQTQNSFDLYNDLGLVVLSRTGSEGSDGATTINEEQEYKVDANGDFILDEAGKKIPLHANETTGLKHYLELTDAEQALIAKVKQNFKKVAVVLNTSHVMEINELKTDDAINAIMWIGRPGENGLVALGELLAGEINPSGSVVDEWPVDFTKDPTWMNFGDNYNHNDPTKNDFTDYDVYYYADGTPSGDRANHGGPGGSDASGSGGFYGVDYEEDIYLGYKYYETRYAEIKNAKGVEVANTWYEENVAYPFGYGQSYSTFSFNLKGGVYTDEALTNLLGDSDGTQFASYVGHEAAVKKLYAPVTVKNTGLVAGKKTVQAYVTAPYTSGETAKSFVVLTGYAKTSTLAPGASETVIVEFNVQDFASFDYDDKDNDLHEGYELDQGDYTIRIMDSSHFDFATDLTDTEDCYDQYKFNISADVNLDLDDYSGNKVEARLNADAGWSNSIREGVNADETAAGAKFTQLDRKDMGTTEDSEIASFPQPANKAARTFSDDFFKSVYEMETYDADNTYTGTDTKNNTNYQQYDDAANLEAAAKTVGGWAGDVNVGADWTQADSHQADYSDVVYKLRDIAGIDPDSDEVISVEKNSKFAGKTGKEAWTLFMNQLTWDEITTIIQQANRHTSPCESIGLAQGKDEDDPLDLNSTYYWQDEPTLSGTFNVDLGTKWGVMVANLGALKDYCDGWYGPGMDTHRTPFSGRNAQYFSQDGIQGGYMAAAVVGGAESRGMLCFCKHAALNDSETNRANNAHFTWASEQTIRENYYKVFQMAFQEGNASGVMTACARIGRMSAGSDYAVCTGMWRKEWGWKGFAITDGYGGIYRPNPSDYMIRTGGDMPLGDSKVESKTTYICWKYTEAWDATQKNYVANITATKSDRDTSGTWDTDARAGLGGVKVGGKKIEQIAADGTVVEKDCPEIDSLAQYYFARTVCQRDLYNCANGLANRNGTTVDFTNNKNGNGLKYDTNSDLGTIKQGQAVSGISVAVASEYLNGEAAVYETEDDALPAGLSIDGNGNLTGTTTADAGTYTFTVTARVAGYITGSRTFTIVVESAFYWDGDEVTTAELGKDFVGYVKSDIITAGGDGGQGGSSGGSSKTISYDIAAGELPAGLTIDQEGCISGTPTEAGEYNFTVEIKVTTPGGWNTAASSVSYYFDMTITVKGQGGDTPVDPDTPVDYQAEIDDLKAQIAALKTEIESQKGQGTDTSALETQLKTLEDKVAALESKSSATKSGCGGSVAVASTAVGMIAMLGAALAFKKKREE